VREAMLPFLGALPGNPSSAHHLGRQARACLDEARERVATLFHCKPSEIVFTSGGTESNNLAILGTARALKDKGRHLVTTAIEHPAVMECFRYLERYESFEVTYVKPDIYCNVSPNSLLTAIRPGTILVSVMALNNEVGARQPVAEIGRICQERGIVFHTDAAQWVGKEPVTDIKQFNADLVSVCAHKIHGPKGAGLLYVKSPLRPQSLQAGGPQENEHRAGTENLSAIIGLATALERFMMPPVFQNTKINNLSEQLRKALARIHDVQVLDIQQLTNNTVAWTASGADSPIILAALDLEGICASGGAACASGALTPSHVLLAMGYPPKMAKSLIRLSLGRENTMQEISFLADVLPTIVRRAITTE
jgi:cysteine desulfurase